MGFSQHGEVHFLKGVPGWSWTPFFIDFRGSGEASGDHLRPPLGDFGRPWGHFGCQGVTLGNFGSPWADFGSLEGHFGLFGGPPGRISPYGGHFVCDLESPWENSSDIS